MLLLAVALADVPATVPSDKPAAEPGADGGGVPVVTDINPAQQVTYRSTDTDIHALLITPKVATPVTPTPSIIIVHEIFGITPFIKTQAETLARQGYTILLPNLYSRLPESDKPYDANGAWSAYNQTRDQQIMEDLSASIQFLQADGKSTAKQPLGIVGYDMGGSFAMLMAGTDLRISVAVNYYGRILYATTSAARPASPVESLFNLRAPLLSFYGTTDPQVPETHVSALRSRLANNPNKTFYEIVLYPNVGHSFLVPVRPGYNKDAAVQSEEKTRLFLARFLRAQPLPKPSEPQS
ncbi:MAG: dienelactone hydrolase family protein [Phycisphaerales bacterium]|nr:dienelactone hydrolase family protein [Phycisphaerales bacterium]